MIAKIILFACLVAFTCGAAIPNQLEDKNAQDTLLHLLMKPIIEAITKLVTTQLMTLVEELLTSVDLNGVFDTSILHQVDLIFTIISKFFPDNTVIGEVTNILDMLTSGHLDALLIERLEALIRTFVSEELEKYLYSLSLEQLKELLTSLSSATGKRL